MPEKTFRDINENILSVISYLGIFVTGFVMLILERDNKKVRFNAMQSFVLFIAVFLISNIFGKIFIIGGLISFVVNIFSLVTYVYLVYMSYRGILVKVPLIGETIYKYIYK